MEEIKTKGIVIKATDYKDSDKIVTIFSADRGIIHARARGVKKAKAKLAFAVQPFAFVEFMLAASGDFYTIINATSIDQFYDITADFDNFIFMSACLELCSKTIKENDDSEEMFLLLLSSLKAVAYDKISAMQVFIKFMLEALMFLGFSVELDSCASCGEKLNNKSSYFSFDCNGLVCDKCASKLPVLEISVGELAILKKINDASFDTLGSLKFLNRDDLISVISLLLKVFRINTDEEIETIKQYL